MRPITKKIEACRAQTIAAAPHAQSPPQLLEELEWYLANHFGGAPITTVETGCGETTLLFSAYSASHMVYALDDREQPGSAVDYVRAWPEPPKGELKWILGNTLLTIGLQPQQPEFDIVLINGAHYYPAPDFECFMLKRQLKANGILAVTSRQIPMVDNLCRFLMQESDLRFYGQKSGVCFFQKLSRAFDEQPGDFWWLQRFNMRHFNFRGTEGPDFGVSLPVEIAPSANQQRHAPRNFRGFAKHDQRWISDGYDSTIQIKLKEPAPGRIAVELDIEPICIGERIALAGEAGLKVFHNWQEVQVTAFTSATPTKIEFAVDMQGKSQLDLELWHQGVLHARDLKGFGVETSIDMRLPSFYLNAIRLRDADQDAAATNRLTKLDGSIFSFDHLGKRFSFFVPEVNDTVANYHANGRFYELEELEMLKGHIKPGSRILEVGAHVGNHTVFFDAFMAPKNITVLEPNPGTRELLKANLALNQVSADLSFAHFALGSNPGQGRSASHDRYNSGGSEIISASAGSIPIATGDTLFAHQTFDFIKIDVEGMEVEVLNGMLKLIARARPLIFIEVMDGNSDAFNELVLSLDYQVLCQAQMYDGMKNMIIAPNRSAGVMRKILSLGLATI
jgi:FkbM family methyltransferase